MTAKTMKERDDFNLVKQMLTNGYSISEIASVLELDESTVRAWAHVIEKPYPWCD